MASLSFSFVPKSSLHPQNNHHRATTTALKVSSLLIDDATTTTKPLKTTTPPPSIITRTAPPPQPARPPPSLAAAILNSCDQFINNFIDPPLKPSLDPRHVLSGNSAPVAELPPTACQVVEGVLPPCLDGAYIRNGPNPHFLPRGPYHLYDGDGMLHAVTISGGEATLCSRYVETHKYKLEREIGFPVVPSLFSSFNGLPAAVARGLVFAARLLTRQVDLTNGVGSANTSVALIGAKLYALGESDLPYTVKIDGRGEIHTLGRHDFGGKLAVRMTAHPKIDPRTGEAFAFRYSPLPPFVTIFRINAEGDKQPDLPIFSMKSPALVHDFAITETYAVFSEIQIGINPSAIVAGGSPVRADLGKVPRIGLIPRYAVDESEMRWFEVPGFNPIHAISAWDEDGGDAVVMVAANVLSVEHMMERMDLIHSSIEKVRIDLKTGTVARHPLSAANLDFGVINPAYVAKKHRYIYATVADPAPKVTGLVKLDMTVSENGRQDCVVASRMFGSGCFGGEPFFVARQHNNLNADEDDGYIVTIVHDENTKESRFIVMDATSTDLDVVAVVRLPRRVPYGFHGLFVSKSDLDKL
ncbi:probable carotenoid cleavage dioxygenase 4, chloroplastic [Salvia miltiorrhiza]|uniref:probable carotenoid cleavage dioxygenase 4, chloroplastic n=1 Tax=Salvia miltiorrhiza TaxID=226208 RepID=UPI0025AD35B5|nr:probable carotenoid cleavage dioxygenase 4, chloroplastic [Salvia miltiorrhiza]